MALKLDLDPQATPKWTADRRICLNADESRAVESDDPEAAFLLVGEGAQIDLDIAVKFGLANPDGTSIGVQESAKTAAKPASGKPAGKQAGKSDEKKPEDGKP